MRFLFSGCAALALGLTLLPIPSRAQGIVTQRCATDSLSIPAAMVRTEWARNCGLQVNVGSPNPSNPGKRVDTEEPTGDGGTFIDYLEMAPGTSDSRNIYSANDTGGAVNETYSRSLYTGLLKYQSVDSRGFFIWTGPDKKKRARPLYPTFGSEGDLYSKTNRQLYPHPAFADCNLYFDPNGQQRADTFFVNAYCESGCYTPEQRILFSDGYDTILDAQTKHREDLLTLTPDSTLGQPKLQRNKVQSYTSDIREAEQLVYEIKTASGGQLRLTGEHPVLLSNGKMVMASTLKKGDELVKVDTHALQVGNAPVGVSTSVDPIASIEETKYFGKVYNLRPVTEDLATNILVAQDYLVGSVAYQNEDVSYINRIILHGSIRRDLVPR